MTSFAVRRVLQRCGHDGRQLCSTISKNALALALMVIATAGADFSLGLSFALAQESERPVGLFDLIFGGSERLGGERSAQPQSLERQGSERQGLERQALESQALERTAQAGAPDLVVRLDRLEAQIRQLTGVIEQLQFRNQQLENQIRRMQEDTDLRGAPRPAGQARPQNVPGQSAPAVVPAPGRRGDAFDPANNPNAPGAPSTLGSIGVPGGAAPRPGEMADASMGVPSGGVPSGGAPSGVAPGAPRNYPGGALAATQPPAQTSNNEFDLAYGHVLRRDYVLAEDGFRAFLSKYPNDRLTGDATFWFGESLFQRQRFRDAAEAFLNVSTKFEGNAKAPDALLRLGQSLAALGEKEAACASLGEVLRKFPRASAGVKVGVEREQKRVRC
jgi:tol-pal system protein YbgF